MLNQQGAGEEARVEAARRALRSYLENVIFDESNEEGELLRQALFASRDPASCDALRRRLLAEAALWGPGSPEWRALEEGDSTILSGRLLQLHTEVLLDGAGRIARAMVSLD